MDELKDGKRRGQFCVYKMNCVPTLGSKVAGGPEPKDGVNFSRRAEKEAPHLRQVFRCGLIRQ
jgi:hypothetical protein